MEKKVFWLPDHLPFAHERQKPNFHFLVDISIAHKQDSDQFYAKVQFFVVWPITSVSAWDECLLFSTLSNY